MIPHHQVESGIDGLVGGLGSRRCAGRFGELVPHFDDIDVKTVSHAAENSKISAAVLAVAEPRVGQLVGVAFALIAYRYIVHALTNLRALFSSEAES